MILNKQEKEIEPKLLMLYTPYSNIMQRKTCVTMLACHHPRLPTLSISYHLCKIELLKEWRQEDLCKECPNEGLEKEDEGTKIPMIVIRVKMLFETKVTARKDFYFGAHLEKWKFLF